MNYKFRLVYFVFIVILLMGTTLIIIGIGNKKKKSKMEAELKIEDIFLKLSTEKALFFSKLVLNCISREYPNKPGHVINDSSEVLTPETLHPAFYGCFDWHSSVHGHWMLVRLLRMFPDLPNADKIRKAISGNLTAENILQEVRYPDQPNRKSFERT